MRLNPQLVEATLITRLNRFAASFLVDGRRVMAHVANSGRMRELMIPKTRMFLAPVSTSGRKTAYDLALVDVGHVLVSADARLPSRLLREAIAAGQVPELRGYDSIRQEVAFGGSRLDLLLSGGRGLCYVEAKSVTLVKEGGGLFPDAPTERGRRHMEALVQAVKEGHRGAVAFVIQREDATSFAPNDDADPQFGQAFREAISQGVEAYAYRCRVTREEVRLSSQVLVRVNLELRASPVGLVRRMQGT